MDVTAGPLGANTMLPSAHEYNTKRGACDSGLAVQFANGEIEEISNYTSANNFSEDTIRRISANNVDWVAGRMETLGTNYKYDEGKYIEEITDYINSTYNQHYSTKSGTQSIDAIIDNGHGTGFCMGNITKYAHRYGKKKGHNRADLMKIIHYAILMLYVHDRRSDKEDI